MTGYLISLGLNAWQTELVRAAKRLGYRVIGVDRNPAAPGVAECAHFLEVSAHDPLAIREALNGLDLGGKKVRAVMTIGSRGSLTSASKLADMLGVGGPVIGEWAAEIVVDRDKFRRFLKSQALPAPQFEVVSAPDAEPDFTAPWIVKSVLDSSGSEGLTVVRDPADLASGIEHALKVSQRADPNPRAIVESFVEGRDLGVFGLFSDGKLTFSSIVDRRVTAFPHCLPDRYAAPASVTTTEEEVALRCFDRLANGLKVGSGPLYAEMRLCAKTGQAFVLECEPTLPAYAARTIAMSLQIDLEELFVKSIVGEPIQVDGTMETAVCRFIYGTGGAFEKLSGEWPAPANGTDVVVVRKPGDRLDPTNCSSICAAVFSSSVNAGDAEKAATEAVSRLTVLSGA